jgi:PPOX class probable F420-dependent enzyme
MPWLDIGRWLSRPVPGDAPGMDHSLAVTRIQRFLEEEPIVWLSTVRPDGTPHVVPVWFWWDGEALLVFSKPNAQKVRNLEAGSSVMLGIGDADEDFDIGLFEGRAEILDRPTAEVLPAGHLAKYATQMHGIGLDAAEYIDTYSLVIRITPSHYLGWHGRSIPQSVRVAGAPLVTIDEPSRVRPSVREWLGEPLASGLRGFGAGLLRPGAAGAL